MNLEKYIVSRIKKVADENHGMQSRIAEATGVERGTVSNRLKGIRASDEPFRRIAAEIAGLDYNELVEEYYRVNPGKKISFEWQGTNAGQVHQAESMSIRNESSRHAAMIPEMESLCRLISTKSNPARVCLDLLKIVDDMEA